ncbi:oxidoreductase domain-containing protein [Xylariaceae sp. AK1471]|nr:oxidoreductase domain-containing protein [Xylariaceae sp. AK1471]
MTHVKQINQLVKRVDFTKTNIPEYAILRERTRWWMGARHDQIVRGPRALYEDSANAVASSRITKLATQIWRRIENLPEAQQILRLGNRPRVTALGPMKRGEGRDPGVHQATWTAALPPICRRRVLPDALRRLLQNTDKREISLFTLHLYLNNANTAQETEPIGDKDGCEKSLIGGTTTFNARQEMTGRVSQGGEDPFFQRDLLNAGDDVLQGVKHTMRIELMYTIEKKSD